MKRTALLLMLVMSSVAYGWNNNPLETVDQARQRQSAENRDTYRNRSNDAPLGGYNRPLGDPEVRGIERPGYVAPDPSGDWRRGLR